MAIQAIVNPITEIFETSEIDAAVKDPALKQLMINLYMKLNRQAAAMSSMPSGMHTLQESYSGNRFFANPALTSMSTTNPVMRPESFQIVLINGIPLGDTPFPLPITTNPQYSTTFIGGGMTNPAIAHRFLPLPYPSATGDNVEIYITPTHLHTVTNTNNYANFSGFVIFYYLTS